MDPSYMFQLGIKTNRTIRVGSRGMRGSYIGHIQVQNGRFIRNRFSFFSVFLSILRQKFIIIDPIHMFQLDIKTNRTIRVGSRGMQVSYIGHEWQNYKKSIFIFSQFFKHFEPKVQYYRALPCSSLTNRTISVGSREI